MIFNLRSQNYFGDAWNVFDFIVVLGSFIDIIILQVDNAGKSEKAEKVTRYSAFFIKI